MTPSSPDLTPPPDSREVLASFPPPTSGTAVKRGWGSPRTVATLAIGVTALAVVALFVGKAVTRSDTPNGMVIPEGWSTRTAASGEYTFAYDPAWLVSNDPENMLQLTEIVAAESGFTADVDGVWSTAGPLAPSGSIIEVLGATYAAEVPDVKSAVAGYLAASVSALVGAPANPSHSANFSSPLGYAGWYEWSYVSDSSTTAYSAVIGISQGDTVVFVYLFSIDSQETWEGVLQDVAASIVFSTPPTSSSPASGYSGAPIMTSDVPASGHTLETDLTTTVAFETPWEWNRSWPAQDVSPMAPPLDRHTTLYLGSWYTSDPSQSDVVPDFVLAIELAPSENPYSTIDEAQAAAVEGALLNTAGATAGETESFTTGFGLDARLTSLRWTSDTGADAESIIVSTGRGHRFVVLSWVAASGPVDRTELTTLLDTLRIDE